MNKRSNIAWRKGLMLGVGCPTRRKLNFRPPWAIWSPKTLPLGRSNFSCSSRTEQQNFIHGFDILIYIYKLSKHIYIYIFTIYYIIIYIHTIYIYIHTLYIYTEIQSIYVCIYIYTHVDSDVFLLGESLRTVGLMLIFPPARWGLLDFIRALFPRLILLLLLD